MPNCKYGVLVAVEGDTERGVLEAFVNYYFSQVPELAKSVEVVPLSTNGDQGHIHLVTRANETINQYLSKCDDTYVESEKWIVCDYDNFDNEAISLEAFKSQAEEYGFKVVVTKPQMEYFILAVLVGAGKAQEIIKNAMQCRLRLDQPLQTEIARINDDNSAGLSSFNGRLKISKFKKERYTARRCFGDVIAQREEYMMSIMRDPTLLSSSDGAFYSELPELLNRIYNIAIDPPSMANETEDDDFYIAA